MRIKQLAAAVGLLAGSVYLTPSWADTPDYSQNLTGDWSGERQALHDQGIDLGATYVGEFAANTSGGDRKTSAYADQISMLADFDFGKLFGWKGGSLHIDLTDRNGDLLDDKAHFGSLLESQEIYGRGSVTRLTRFYLEQQLWDGKIDLKFGRMDISEDFFPFSCNFQSLNFCASLPGYITQGWYTMPIAQTGGSIQFSPNAQWYVKLGAFEVNANNTDKNVGLRFAAPGPDTGVMGILEAGYNSSLGDQHLPGTWVVGTWRNTSPYPDLYSDIHGQPQVLTGQPAQMRNGTNGYYFTAKQQVVMNDNGGGLTLFANVVQADPHTDHTDQLISAGFFLNGLFSTRPNDRLDFAIGRDQVSHRLAEAAEAENAAGLGPVGIPGDEYDVELNYAFHVWNGVQLMPNVQYIRHPGGLSQNGNATVFGLQLAVSL